MAWALWSTRRCWWSEMKRRMRVWLYELGSYLVVVASYLRGRNFLVTRIIVPLSMSNYDDYICILLADTSRSAPHQSLCCLLCKHTRHGIARLHGRVKPIRSKTLVGCIAIGEVDTHCVEIDLRERDAQLCAGTCSHSDLRASLQDRTTGTRPVVLLFVLPRSRVLRWDHLTISAHPQKSHGGGQRLTRGRFVPTAAACAGAAAGAPAGVGAGAIASASVAATTAEAAAGAAVAGLPAGATAAAMVADSAVCAATTVAARCAAARSTVAATDWFAAGREVHALAWAPLANSCCIWCARMNCNCDCAAAAAFGGSICCLYRIRCST